MVLIFSGLAGRLGTRYAIRASQRPWSFGSRSLQQVQGSSSGGNSNKVKGRFMLEPEALSCLLVLLFLDEPKLNTTRLHRVLRNLCYHGPTRAWLIRALLSIVQRAGGGNILPGGSNALCAEERQNSAGYKGKGKKSSNSNVASNSSTTSFSSLNTSLCDPSSNSSLNTSLCDPSSNSTNFSGLTASRGFTTTTAVGASGYWLSISLEAALGCRANVFQVHRSSGKKSSSSSPATVSIHPQAAPVVCRHALDTLISLAKVFPTHFLPASKSKEAGTKTENGKDDDSDLSKRSSVSAVQSSPKLSRATENISGSTSSVKNESRSENDFWNILLRLDSVSGKSKGKCK